MSQLGLISKHETFFVQGTSGHFQPESWSTYSSEPTLTEARWKASDWQKARPEIKKWRIVKASVTTTHEAVEAIK